MRLDVLKTKNRFVNHKGEMVRGEREAQETEGCATLNSGAGYAYRPLRDLTMEKACATVTPTTPSHLSMGQ